MGGIVNLTGIDLNTKRKLVLKLELLESPKDRIAFISTSIGDDRLTDSGFCELMGALVGDAQHLTNVAEGESHVVQGLGG